MGTRGQLYPICPPIFVSILVSLLKKITKYTTQASLSVVKITEAPGEMCLISLRPGSQSGVPRAFYALPVNVMRLPP